MPAITPFGTLSDGRPVEEIRLAAPGIRAAILSYGAIIRDLEVETPAGWQRVVLGYDSLPPYLTDSPYFGAIVGRCANRIGNGRFPLDGRMVQLDRNDGGRAHLHGGAAGFDKRLWTIKSFADDQVTLQLVSPDGEEGYPGTLTATCTYWIAPGTITFDLSAETDAPTLVNLAGHSYFNLSGGGSVFDHVLTLHADRYTPVDGSLITTGRIVPVEGTPFDFRRPKRIGDGRTVPYDHNFVVGDVRSVTLRPVARLHAPETGITLEIRSTEPGVQFYDGNMLNTTAAPTLLGRPAVLNDALCLEPQMFPNAANHPGWPSPVLRPGETYRQTTEYRFNVPA